MGLLNSLANQNYLNSRTILFSAGWCCHTCQTKNSPCGIEELLLVNFDSNAYQCILRIAHLDFFHLRKRKQDSFVPCLEEKHLLLLKGFVSKSYLDASHGQESAGCSIGRFSAPRIVLNMCTFVCVKHYFCDPCLNSSSTDYCKS